MAYNWWRKSFQFFRIGGLNLFFNPPKKIDLGIEVRMDRRVEFRDLDMNQHYTVEMIVGRSVDGVEQLMLMSGLTLVELYYKRNLFAAKIQSTFHKELAHNDRYTIHTKITRVAGSLMDIRVAFLDADETLCFEILWTILIVLDSNERILLDWENVDLMEGRTLTAGPGKNRVEAPATPLVAATPVAGATAGAGAPRAPPPKPRSHGLGGAAQLPPTGQAPPGHAALLEEAIVRTRAQPRRSTMPGTPATTPASVRPRRLSLLRLRAIRATA